MSTGGITKQALGQKLETEKTVIWQRNLLKLVLCTIAIYYHSDTKPAL